MEEGRNLSYIHLDPGRIEARCRNWFFLDDFGQARNASESDNGHNFNLWTVNRSRYNHQNVHNEIIQVGGFSEDNLRTITVKPLNHVSAYYDPRVHKIWHEPVREATLWMETSGWLVICGEIMRESYMDATFSPHFAGNRNVLFQNAQCIPLYYNLRESRLRSRRLEEIQRYCLLYGLPTTIDGANGNQRRLTKDALIDSLPTFDNGALRLPNLSSDIFERIHGTLPDEIERYGQTSESVWGHVLAIMCSSEYSDLPVSSWGVGSRIPFAFGDDQDGLLENSARLGQFIRDISTNTISDQFEDFQSSVGEWLGELIPINGGGDPTLDIQLDGWCARIEGKWKIDPRVRNSQIHSTDPIQTESEALQALAGIWGFEMDEIYEILGGQQVSLCLNPEEGIILPPIPRAVYDFSIGGHRVLNNYLAWRDYYNLQRNIYADDIEQLRDVIHSITCLVLLGPRLAENLGSFIQHNE